MLEGLDRPAERPSVDEADEVPFEHAVDEPLDVLLELRWPVGHTGAKRGDDLGESPLAIDELPDEQPDLVHAEIGSRFQLEQHAPIRFREGTSDDVGVFLDLHVPVHTITTVPE